MVKPHLLCYTIPMISNATLSARSAGISMEFLCNTTYDCRKGEKTDDKFTNLCIPTAFVLDLKVMLNDDRILNFEVQVIDEKDWSERSLTYASRTFDQLQKGETYLDVKPVRHIGFLDYTLKDFTPEFYATYQLLNVKNHEIYSSKFALSVVNLNQIELATEEDQKYGIDHWARLFKATTWEAIKKMAQENEYISSAAETMFESARMRPCASSWKVWKKQTASVVRRKNGWKKRRLP